jgi:hypothetical protein
MKYIREFHNFSEFATYMCAGIGIWAFVDTVLRLKINSILKKSDANTKNIISHFLIGLKDTENIQVSETDNSFSMSVNIEDDDYDVELLKKEKKLIVDNNKLEDQLEVQLNDEEYSNFLKIIKK